MKGQGLELAELHREFSDSFSCPLELETPARDRLLLIRCAEQALAAPMSEVAGLELIRKLTPLPENAFSLLGLMGLRGRVIPVFDLCAILGLPRTRETEWALLAGSPGSDEELALGLTAYHGFAEIPHQDIIPLQGAGAPQGSRHVQELAKTSQGTVGIVRIGSIARELAKIPAATGGDHR